MNLAGILGTLYKMLCKLYFLNFDFGATEDIFFKIVELVLLSFFNFFNQFEAWKFLIPPETWPILLIFLASLSRI